MDGLVSVVVPVYNVEKYLNRCIDSIVNQTYQNIEIILIDDGSTDTSGRICDARSLRDRRIKVVHKENSGLGMARNTGIEKATGDYICFIDSDDYVSENLVEICLSKAVSFGADVVLFGMYNVFDDGRTVKCAAAKKEELYTGDLIRNKLLPGLFTYDLGYGVSSCGKFLNLKSLKKLALKFKSEREVVSEDAYFSLELFSGINSALVIVDRLYYYYKRETSLSRSFDNNRQQKNDIFYCKCLELVKEKQLPEQIVSSIGARYHTYSLVCMKQIIGSELTKKEKYIEFRKVFENKLLYSSVTPETINLAITPSKVFWSLFKMRISVLCYLLLLIKSKK